MEFIQHTLNKRPNTRWELALLTNLQAVVYPLDFPAGAFVSLPNYIKNSKSIKGLDISKQGVPYTDNLCAFRCLAHFSDKSSEVYVRELFQQYLTHTCSKEKDFKGVPFSNMTPFEDCFQINVNVYSLFEDDSAEPMFKSLMRYEKTMFLNLYDNHFSLITKIESYCKKYKCS